MFLHAHACMHTHTRMHAHTHTHTHTHTHAHTHTQDDTILTFNVHHLPLPRDNRLSLSIRLSTQLTVADSFIT